MNPRNVLIGAFLIVLVGSGGYVGYRYVSSRNQKCKLCARSVHSNLAADVLFKNGSRIRTCCPRCALHLELQNPGKIAELKVNAVDTGEMIAADTASYLEGSSAEQHHPDPAADETHQLREPGVLYDLAYDRCMPNLLAFKSELAAHEFRKHNGGTVLTYSDALESVRNR